jgi:hypothetical protein
MATSTDCTEMYRVHARLAVPVARGAFCGDGSGAQDPCCAHSASQIQSRAHVARVRKDVNAECDAAHHAKWPVARVALPALHDACEAHANAALDAGMRGEGEAAPAPLALGDRFLHRHVAQGHQS